MKTQYPIVYSWVTGDIPKSDSSQELWTDNEYAIEVSVKLYNELWFSLI